MARHLAMLQTYEPPRSLRSRENLRLAVPGTNTKFGERAFAYVAPSSWNNLPERIKTARDVPEFKRPLKTFFFFFKEEYSCYL